MKKNISNHFYKDSNSPNGGSLSTTINHNSKISLDKDLRIRAEQSSVLFFQPKNQTVVMLDVDEAKKLQDTITKNELERIPKSLVNKLLKHEIIIQNTNSNISDNLKLNTIFNDCIEKSSAVVSPLRSLHSPEALHIALTYRCDQQCQGCYFPINNGNSDMPFDLFKDIITSAASCGVLQVALGGGEALLVKDIYERIALCKEMNILPSLTTNGNLVNEKIAKKLKESGLAHLQVSLNGATPMTNSLTRPNYSQTIKALKIAAKAGLSTGINYVVTNENIKEIEKIISLAEKLECKVINFLRLKHSDSDPIWLKKNEPSPKDYAEFRKILISTNTTVDVRIDSSFTFLLSDVSPNVLYKNGIWGCTAGRRFLSILPNGDITPCSHIPDKVPFTGDLLDIWHNSKLFDKFRSVADNVTGSCGSCSHVFVCHGCRAVISNQDDDFFNSDDACPKKYINPSEKLDQIINDDLYHRKTEGLKAVWSGYELDGSSPSYRFKIMEY